MVKKERKNTIEKKSFGNSIMTFGVYKDNKIKTVPTEYLHWLVYNNDNTAKWIRENHKECYNSAQNYFISYENRHTEGNFRLYFGRYKGMKLKEVPSRYLTWLSNKGRKESINWVRDNHPDAVINAQNYLKNNSLCFKCGKKVEDSNKVKSRRRLVLKKRAKQGKSISSGKKIHKACLETNIQNNNIIVGQ